MNAIFKKALALLLVIFMLPLVSCSKAYTQTQEIESETEQRLVIEDVFVPYTDQDKQRITSRLLGVFSAVANLTQSELSEEQIQSITKRIEKSIIPFLEVKHISPEQVETAIPEKITASTVIDIYWTVVSVIGSEQTGRILYEMSGVWLEFKASACRDLYAESGDALDLDRAIRYSRQKWELENKLGEECFVEASDFIFSCVSTIKNKGMGAGIGNLMQGDVAGAVLSVLRKQSEEAERLSLTEEQWGIATEILFEITLFDIQPTGKMSELQLARLEKLKNSSDIANAIGQSIPDLISIYAQVVHSMKGQEMSLILSKRTTEKIKGICSALSRGEKRLVEWAKKMQQIEIDDSKVYALIEEAGLADEYEAYAAKRQGTSIEDIFEVIRACSGGEQEISKAQLMRSAEDLMFCIAPYTTFIFKSGF